MAELTTVAARNAKPREKAYRLAAGKGLYLQVMPNGAKYWRLKYRFPKTPKMISLGVFPEVSLAAARAARDDARRLLASGVDPSTQRRVDRLRREIAVGDTFEACARAWFAEHAPGVDAAGNELDGRWVYTYASGVLGRLVNHVFPWIGSLPISEVNSGQLLQVLQRIVAKGAVESAHRVLNYMNEIFRWAIRAGKTKHNVAADVVGALPPAVPKSFPTLTDPDAIGGLLRAIDGYTGTYVTRYALKLAPLVFTRPSEMRLAEWSEFDLDRAEWRVPASRLKMRNALKAVAESHLVPLSRQAVAILRDLQPLSGAGRYLFPGARSAKQAMSNGTLNAALHRLGYKDELVVHGLRHMASTALNEAGWSPDAIERQLGHKDRNRIRGIYNQAQYLDERRRMMQAWADYLDGLRSAKPASQARLAG